MYALYATLTYKELRGFIANRGLAVFTLAFVPLFMLFFGLFIYPYLGPPEMLAEMYQYGLLFVGAYPLLVAAFMNMGTNIALETLQGTTLKLATMPIDRRIEALGRLTGHFITGLFMVANGVLALTLAAYLRGVTPLPSPLRLAPLVYASIPPFYLMAAGIALPAAAMVKGRMQIYNIVAVGAINILPFLSGMFVPLFMLPEGLQWVNQFNPYATPFYLYLTTTSGYTAPIGNGGLLLASYLISVAVFWVGLHIYQGALRSGVR